MCVCLGRVLWPAQLVRTIYSLSQVDFGERAILYIIDVVMQCTPYVYARMDCSNELSLAHLLYLFLFLSVHKSYIIQCYKAVKRLALSEY